MNTAGRESAPKRRSAASGAIFVGAWLAVGMVLAVLAGCGGGGGDGGEAASRGAPSRGAARGGLESLPGAIYDPPKPAPALRLTDAEGRPFDLAGERGRVALVFFGFTECPDICPATLQQWARV
ncbi:MAG TPA: SCO family protein, partial [Candidatus Eisenbacteria bacterium]